MPSPHAKVRERIRQFAAAALAALIAA